ncbi:nucleoporin nsp1 [Trichosporon asahii var. asahii CBS 8904]|uniref:Nucleoporin nsp1 n=1 Tax=Trichosporon asahii var. asahii (strain CBS 8904) TaxID=1220162 RepID=K1W3E8_TRIAC|nr:nucleoporin nsp1 [Trichosporon asahii var. asahii CBS 8904]
MSEYRTLPGAVRSPRKQRDNLLPYARPPTTPNANGPTLRRSTSMLGGLKSLFSRPLNWISTPNKQAEQDVEADAARERPALAAGLSPPQGSKNKRGASPESPSDGRNTKRSRKASPEKPVRRRQSLGNLYASSTSTWTPARGPYEPASSKALPSLTPGSLRKANRMSLAAPPSAYLDPPRSMLAPSSPSVRGTPRRSDFAPWDADREREHSALARSDLAHFGESAGPGTARAASLRSHAPRRSDAMMFSNSPFRAGSGFSRSTTAVNLSSIAGDDRMEREGTAQSDVSMRTGSLRGSSRLRQRASMHFDEFGSIPESSEAAHGGTLDWMTSPRASTYSRLSHARSHGSLGQSQRQQPTPIRRGQMVFDAERGFIRESDLEAEKPKPVAQNEAERILFHLEALRKPTKIEKKTPAPSTGLPPSLIGSSSRQLRKAISVPLATQADKEKTKKKHGSEWLADKAISAMISPYGRRRAVDELARSQRRELAASRRAEAESASDVSDMEVDNHSKASSRSRRSTRSRSKSSYASDDMSVDEPRQKLRRSARHAKSPDQEETTPKATRRSTRLRASQAKSPEPTPRRSTRKKAAASPEPEPEQVKTPTKAKADVPTVVTIAPSPSSNSSSTYQVRDDSEPRPRSSLRAGPERKTRAHQGAASYSSSRATSPGTGSGRFSARDEDLPQMDELENAKIPLASFKNFSIPMFGNDAKKDEPKESTTPAAPSEPQLSSRLSVPSSSQSTQQRNAQLSSLGNRLNGLQSRPRASSPLANNSIVAEASSPETTPKKDSAPAPITSAPKSPPPSTGFFSLSGAASGSSSTSLTPTGSTTPAGKPPASNFFSKPATSTTTPAPESTAPKAADGGVPNFFGGSKPTSGASTPPPKLDFGIKPAETGPPVVSNLFSGSNGDALKPTEGSKAPFSFGSTTSVAEKSVETPKPAFNFGAPAADKPADAPKASSGGFSFGSSSAAPAADKPTEAPKPAFSFGTPSASPAPAADKLAETKAPFSFGSGSSTPAASTPAAGDKPAFSFGAPATSTDKPAAEKPAFSFGSASSTPAPSTDKPAADKPAFSFGASSSPAPSGGSSFGSVAPATDKPAFSFGSSTTATDTAKPEEKKDKPAFSFGSSSAAPASSGFGSSNGSTAPAADKPAFSFGSSSASPAPAAAAPSSGGFSFGSSSAAKPAEAAKPFSFGSSNAPPTSTPSVNGGDKPFSFGAPSTPAAPASGSAPASGGFSFGSSNSTPSNNFGAGSTSNTFGSTNNAAAPSTPSFTFGASSSTPANANAGSSGFGTAGASSSTPGGSGSFTFGAGSGFGSTNNASSSAGGGSGFGSGPGFGGSSNNSPSTGATSGFGVWMSGRKRGK